MSSAHLDCIKLGDALPALTLAPVNRTTLALFAGASNDHNAIHIDIDYARRAGMPDVFAHGMLSMAWLGRLLTQWVDQRRLRQFSARFTGITHLGHQITCSGKVVELFEVDGERRARIEIQTANQYGETKILGDAVIAL
ncbi:MAG: MaoC family dehydratase [Pseudomonadota bacterium]|jgi:acyl dehydratase